MKQILAIYLPAALFAFTIILLVAFPVSVDFMRGLVSHSGYQSYVLYVLMLVIATVAMPITVMPLIPVAAGVLGPFVTGVLSVFGWTLGAVIAFWLSRNLGRPILERYISFSRIDDFTSRLPVKTRFFSIILLRLTIPVDIASYALGLTRSVGLLEYTLATLVGVIWFSFAFAYLGDALLTGNIPLLIELGSASLLLFIVGWYMLRKHR